MLLMYFAIAYFEYQMEVEEQALPAVGVPAPPGYISSPAHPWAGTFCCYGLTRFDADLGFSLQRRLEQFPATTAVEKLSRVG